MQTARKYIVTPEELKMIKLMIGISDELLLRVVDTQEGLRQGRVKLSIPVARVCAVDENPGSWYVKIEQKEVRAIADAFTFLADLLDEEKE